MYGVFMILYRIIPCHACIWVCMYVGRIFLISHLSYHVCVCLCVVCGACCGARLSRDRRGDGWCRMAILRLTRPEAIIRKRRPPSSRTGGHPRSGRPTAISSHTTIIRICMYVCMYGMIGCTYLRACVCMYGCSQPTHLHHFIVYIICLIF